MGACEGRPDSKELFQVGWFAMVMATGIISLSCHEAGLHVMAHLLFWLNCMFYVSFGAAIVVRIAGRSFLSDIDCHSDVVGYFTIPAGTCVLASQCLILVHSVRLAVVLFAVGTVAWLLLVYVVLSHLILHKNKEVPSKSISGSWFLLTVSAQSFSILMSLLVPHLPSYQTPLTLAAWMLLMTGAMHYITVLPIIFYRLVFLPVSSGQFNPAYWISMGASAITALSAALFESNASHELSQTAAAQLSPALMVLFWSFASWWVPILVVMEIIYHHRFHLPVRYVPGLWGLVFPIGMYVVCTDHVGQVIHLPFLSDLAHVLAYPALIIWLLVFYGFVARVISKPGRLW